MAKNPDRLSRPASRLTPTRALTRARARTRARRGFLIMESALATVIIAVGVLAVIQAVVALSRTNDQSSLTTVGTYLAGEIRERMARLPRHDPVTGLYLSGGFLRGWGPEDNEDDAEDFDDADDFNGAVFGDGAVYQGPIDAAGRVITGVNQDGTISTDPGAAMAGWTQVVTVEKVLPNDFSVAVAPEFVLEGTENTPTVAIDRFPLRVTVRVMYRGWFDSEPREMARVVWIVD
ncbi:MAG: hypothetical protein C0475_03665 [Planctomyces sp.]|nr:hypothetical protein [Planctomyces sp.]